jgi:hypothetical protein
MLCCLPSERSSVKLALTAAAWVLAAFLAPLPLDAAQPGTAGQPASAASPDPSSLSPLSYDTEYPLIGYSGAALSNPIAVLQTRLAQGAVKLEFKLPRGYLDSLLAALGISPSSQCLVYSKTSLQSDAIDAATPRAIYFDEETYVSWIPDTSLIEIATMDAAKGPVFYILVNALGRPPTLDRQMGACLQCHDTYGLMGGGVPRFIVLSTIVDIHGDTLTGGPGFDTTDETPLEQRWGGWYVTGNAGPLRHRGNVQVSNPTELADAARGRHWNIDSVAGLFDTKPYLTRKSDIVALLVLEHQVYIKDLLARARFKSSRILAQLSQGSAAEPAAWSDLSPAAQQAMRPLWEGVVRALLFVHAARIEAPIHASSGFEAWFEARGPRDGLGRSLRQLDLQTRLFRFPLSYVVYSEAFDALPRYARDYVYRRIADVLEGRDRSDEFAQLSAEDRKAILAILTATKPAFARIAGQGR